MLALILANPIEAKNYIPYGYKFEPGASYAEKRKPEKGRGTYRKDPNVWVYSREFAERFGMPEKWIDSNLKGAEAIAYRVDVTNTEICGYFGDPSSCRPTIFCLFDVYLKDEDGAKLPWESHKLSDWSDWDASAIYLSVQKKDDDLYWYDETRGRRYGRRGSKALRSISWVSGKPKRRKNGKKVAFSSHADMYARSYRRDFYKGLDLIQLKSCSMATHTARPVNIDFLDPMPSMMNPKNRLPNGKINHEKLEVLKKRRYAKWFAGTPPHKVRLPDQYMERVNVYDKVVRQKRSLEAEAWRRFNKTKESRVHQQPAETSLWRRILKWLVE